MNGFAKHRTSRTLKVIEALNDSHHPDANGHNDLPIAKALEPTESRSVVDLTQPPLASATPTFPSCASSSSGTTPLHSFQAHVPVVVEDPSISTSAELEAEASGAGAGAGVQVQNQM